MDSGMTSITEKVDAALSGCCLRLKGVTNIASGCSHIDVMAWSEHGVMVTKYAGGARRHSRVRESERGVGMGHPSQSSQQEYGNRQAEDRRMARVLSNSTSRLRPGASQVKLKRNRA